jgi:long-chain acyl-CoA synthetase
MGFEKRTGVPLIEGYGLTEASPIVSANLLYGTDEMRRSGTIGFPLPGTDWRIVDRTDPHRDLGIGEGPEDKDHIGELAVNGPQVMVGYLDNPAETEAHFFEEDGRRWLLTGDIGFMNQAGMVTILDRKKELIKVKGFSVFPKDVENLLGRHPAISEVAVAGLPDSQSTELIKAWVVLKPEFVGKVTEAEIIAWSKENITHYKVPRQVEFRESIPKNLVGKVLRRELREHDPLWPQG